MLQRRISVFAPILRSSRRLLHFRSLVFLLFIFCMFLYPYITINITTYDKLNPSRQARYQYLTTSNQSSAASAVPKSDPPLRFFDWVNGTLAQGVNRSDGGYKEFINWYRANNFDMDTPSFSHLFNDYAGFFGNIVTALQLMIVSVQEHTPVHMVIDSNSVHASAFTSALIDPLRDTKSPLFLMAVDNKYKRSSNVTHQIVGFETDSRRANLSLFVSNRLKKVWDIFIGGQCYKSSYAAELRQHCTVTNPRPRNFVLHEMFALEAKSGSSFCRRAQVATARLFWQLSPDVIEEVNALEAYITAGDHGFPPNKGMFFAVHLRRGDKAKEVPLLDVTKYVEKVAEILRNNTADAALSLPEQQAVAAVYVLSDDEFAAKELIRKLEFANFSSEYNLTRNTTVKGYTWLDLMHSVYNASHNPTTNDLVEKVVKYQSRYGSLTGQKGYDWQRMIREVTKDAEAKHYLTQALISSTELAIRADHFIGTFSSGHSYFIDLIRANEKTTTSVDSGWQCEFPTLARGG